MRRGFNLLMAIGMILLLSGAAVMTMKYVSISAEHITDSYVKEEAQLFAQSVLESVILKVQGYNRKDNNDCLKGYGINSANGKFHAEVTIERYYLYDGKDNDGSSLTDCPITSIETRESHGYINVTIIVTTNNSHKKIKNFVSPVRIVKRSVQRV